VDGFKIVFMSRKEGRENRSVSIKTKGENKMRNIIWSAIALAMILPVMLFTASCTTINMVQTQPGSTSEPEVQKAPDRSVEETEQTGRLKWQISI
jgi:hypothetical protein